MKQSIQLLDLIPKEKLDEILQAVGEACGVSSVIVDTGGRPISSETNFTRFCRDYCRATEKGRLRCYESDAYGGEMALRQREPFVYDCLNAGLVNCATPIIVEGHHLANLTGGQVLEEPIAEADAIKRARAIGIEDIDGYLQALRKIPRISRSRLSRIVNLMSVITQTISDLAMQKTLLAKQSREYLNKVINSVSDCIISIDADFNIVMINESCADIFVSSLDELHGRSFFDLLQEGEQFMDCRVKLEGRGADSCRVELTAMKMDGSAFPAQVSIARVDDEDGDLAGYVAVLRDITEEKRVEKLKEDLVGMLTHDMRNPILAINRTLGLLSTGRLGAVNEDQQKIMKLAISTNDQLGSMVNSLLDIFRSDNRRFELQRHFCDINQLIRECIEESSILAEEKNLEIRFETAQPVIELYCDHFRIKGTIGNIISNAINYSQSGGKVSIATRKVRGDDASLGSATPARLKGRLRHDCEYLWGVVADTGYGIPEELQDAVFEKFFTIKSESRVARRGIGLGLAFCKLVVEAHDGLIFCRTPLSAKRGRKYPGVEFHILLPCDRERT
jgi:PAS domain S-box-containing protein